MKKKNVLFALLLLTLLVITVSVNAQDNSNKKIAWSEWSESLLKKAKKENKFIILDLEAVWCHWCHVMHETTYQDESIMEILEKDFIPVRVDQDSRPDLANLYKDYGWPATIIFDKDGKELRKLSGYIPTDELKFILEDVIQNPQPAIEEIDESKIKFSQNPQLSKSLKKQLEKMHNESYDTALGGLKLAQKFLDSDSIEYSLIKTQLGDTDEEINVRKTLDSAIALIDPVWGGAYQYSTMSVWSYPHFEKLAYTQAKFMRLYSLGYKVLGDSDYLKAAQDIQKYLVNFLMSPEGVFYVSQDADVKQGEHSAKYFAKNDIERRKEGIPKVDTHIYSSQNGLIIAALIALYNATDDKNYLEEAMTASAWIIENRGIRPKILDVLKFIFSDFTDFNNILKNLNWIIENKTWNEFGYRHDKKDGAGPYLCDSLNMGQAFIELYLATKNKIWLTRAEQIARFIDRHFTAPIAGFATSEASCKVCANRAKKKLLAENIQFARFSNLLYKITKDENYKRMCEHSLKYLNTPEIATSTLTEPGILIVDLETKE